MAKKMPAPAPVPFDKREYRRQRIRDRLGALLQLLFEDALQSLVMGKQDARPRLPLDRCEAIIDDLLWSLEQEWDGEETRTVKAPHEPLERNGKEKAPVVPTPAKKAPEKAPEEPAKLDSVSEGV